MEAIKIDIKKRIEEYDKSHCWQYDIRLKNLKDDIKFSGLPNDEILKLSVNDFNIYLADKNEFQEIKDFIIRHEWLGTLPSYPTHYFVARYKNVLAGVIIMSMPNAFSKLLGDNTKDLERLISRGACVSWSPKNLASHMMLKCIKWMVNNTQYRLFTAYSDPTAKELGTIYQACNFYYIGQKSGSNKRYRLPDETKWVSDRIFRRLSSYKRYAKELGIKWEDNWSKGRSVIWGNIPQEIIFKLKEKSKKEQSSCEIMEMPSKHKYVFVLGENKFETKNLRKKFLERNKIYDYPKNR